MGPLWQFDDTWGAGFGVDTRFVADPTQVIVAGGICQLVVMRSSTSEPRPFTGVILSTRGRWSQAFGTWEARMRLPSGYALWPALWLDQADGTWPPEIDFVESLPDQSTGVGAPRASARLHYGSDNRQLEIQMPTTADLTQFHVYKMVWTPSSLAFSLDGVPVGEITHDIPETPMFPIVDLTVGDSGHRADGRTPTWASLDIDYIRISA